MPSSQSGQHNSFPHDLIIDQVDVETMGVETNGVFSLQSVRDAFQGELVEQAITETEALFGWLNLQEAVGAYCHLKGAPGSDVDKARIRFIAQFFPRSPLTREDLAGVRTCDDLPDDDWTT